MLLSLTFTEEKGETLKLKPNIKEKENYVMWITLEPWLNTYPCIPLTCMKFDLLQTS